MRRRLQGFEAGTARVSSQGRNQLAAIAVGKGHKPTVITVHGRFFVKQE